MSEADKRLIELANSFSPPSSYTVRAGTVIQLLHDYADAPLGLFSLAFSMGFIKGQNAAKNEARRAAK